MNRKEFLDDIKRYIEVGEMSFLIGAGFSRNVNNNTYPLWGELLEDAAWNLYGDSGKATKAKKQKVLRKVEKEIGYLGLASNLVKKAGYHEAIDTYIEKRTPYLKSDGKKHVLMKNGKVLPDCVNPECHLLLKNLNIQNIYTFNYDNALEYFMGEEARLELENDICKLEDGIDALRIAKKGLKQHEDEIKELIDSKAKKEEKQSPDGVSEMESDNSTDNDKLDKELKETQKEIAQNVTKEQELLANLETKKQSRETYYNVVKDSYDISLSARRKSIYKIHGSLREPSATDYGFDGDAHTQYIITQEDYDTYNDKHGAFVSMMRIDLLRNRFCIMGVSGGDANFLAWINWVKDVLDKTRVRSGNSEKHQSYFIYSSSDEMPQEMKLMLRNHFIEPVILKDLFPNCLKDEERIKSFLEYVQPANNDDAVKFNDLWNSIDVIRSPRGVKKSIAEQTSMDLLRLAEGHKFYLPQSAVHYVANHVQLYNHEYLTEKSEKAERALYAAAVQCSMIPIDVTCGKNEWEQMEREPDHEIKAAFDDALSRIVLLKNLPVKGRALKELDDYTRVMLGLFNYHFPTADDLLSMAVRTGIDYVRQYTLLTLIRSEEKLTTACEASDFNSFQEFALAADWLRILSNKHRAFSKKVDEYKQQARLFSLNEYCRAYLEAMRRHEEVSAYGDVSETIYMDSYDADVVNGAVLLNSFVELGVCFASRSILKDAEWLELVKALKSRYGAVLIFCTIVRGGKTNVLKVVAQEMMYDERAKDLLSSVIQNIIVSLVSENTPDYLKGRMAQFATEIMPAVNKKYWARQLAVHAEGILDVADRYRSISDNNKSLYKLVTHGLDKISSKGLKLRLLKRVLNVKTINDDLTGRFNSLAISSAKGLSEKDFKEMVSLYHTYADKAIEANSQQGCFVAFNLIKLLPKDEQERMYGKFEQRALRDGFLIEGYAYRIKGYSTLVSSFKEHFLQGEDLWHSGINNDGVSIGLGNVNVSTIDKYLSFNEEQTMMVYENMKVILGKIDRVLNKQGRSKEDNGWLSAENNFRDIVSDMRIFVHRHRKQLGQCHDCQETTKLLLAIYDQCYFGKDIYQLIADDKVYRAIRRIIVEIEIFGIDCFRLVYEQLIGRIIAHDTKELSILFRHIAWVTRRYAKFFDTNEFKELLAAILKIYEPYFSSVGNKQKAWDMIGCEKEIAEKCLMDITDTLANWGRKDKFWSVYKRVYYYEN